jgi:NAD+ dependent glucose-6-phosphate dehydrogenase
MKLLITGAGGFLGKGLIASLEKQHTLRLMDIAPFSTTHEQVIGDVADAGCVRAAVTGMEGLIIAHMAPNRPEVYAHPALPFDVNVKGTANLLAAAQEQGLRRVVLISSTSVVGEAQRKGDFLTSDTPPGPVTMYALTKVCQENIARFYAHYLGMSVAVLRPGYVIDADTMQDKYDRHAKRDQWHLIDRRDIGQAAHHALTLPDVKYEVFYILGPPEADRHADVAHAREWLGWIPDHRFAEIPAASVGMDGAQR